MKTFGDLVFGDKVYCINHFSYDIDEYFFHRKEIYNNDTVRFDFLYDLKSSFTTSTIQPIDVLNKSNAKNYYTDLKELVSSNKNLINKIRADKYDRLRRIKKRVNYYNKISNENFC